jgi:hypothetical protein
MFTRVNNLHGGMNGALTAGHGSAPYLPGGVDGIEGTGHGPRWYRWKELLSP